MKLANRSEYRMMRGLGLWNPLYHLKEADIRAATIRAHEQHRWHDEPLHASRARAIARLCHQKRRGSTRRRLLALVLLIVVLGAHYAHCQSGSYSNFNLGRIYNSANNAIQVYCVAGTCTGGAGGGSAITSWGGGTLGAMANYGTSPGVVLVPGVNAFITNSPAVTGSLGRTWTLTSSDVVSAVESGAWTVQQGTPPWLAQGFVFNTTQPTYTVDATKAYANLSARGEQFIAKGVSGFSIDNTGFNVNNFPASQAVTGTFWQVTQPVSGTFWQATQPVSGTFWQATQPVSLATLPALTAGTAVIGHVIVDTAPTTAVTGTFFQATQPVSGTVTSRIVGNAGATLDAAPAAALPTNGLMIAGRDSTQTGGGAAVPVVCDKSAAITATAVGSVVVIPLAASKLTYICGFVVTGAGAAGTMQWKSGTGTTCGTSTTTLTGTMATAIGGTISYGGAMGTVMRDAAAAQDTCITMATTSATAAGVVSFAQF